MSGDYNDRSPAAANGRAQGFGTGIRGAFYRSVAGLASKTSFCAFPGVQRRMEEQRELEEAAKEDERHQRLDDVQAALRALQIQADVLQKEIDTHMDRAERCEQMGLLAMRQGNTVQQRVHVRNSVTQRNLATQKSTRIGLLQERMQGAELAVSSAKNAELAASLDVATASAVSGMHANIFCEEIEDKTHDALTDMENIRDNEHGDMASKWTEASGYEACGESDIDALMEAQRAMVAAELDDRLPQSTSAGATVEYKTPAETLPTPPQVSKHGNGASDFDAKRLAMQDVFRM